MPCKFVRSSFSGSNQPKHEVWAGPLASPDPCVSTGTDEYKQIRQVWLKHLADEPKDPVLLNHSSNFLRFSDPATVEPALQSGINETDKAAVFQGDQGDLYRRTSLGITSVDPVADRPSTGGDRFPEPPFAQKARSVLTKTEDLRILFSVLAVISSAGPSLAKAGQLPAGYVAFCEQLLASAKQQYADVMV